MVIKNDGEINIEEIVFLDSDTIVFKEGIEEWKTKYETEGEIDPVSIFFKHNGKYYARGDRHRTYFYYFYLKRKTIPFIKKNIPLDKTDKKYLKEGGVTIHDLRVENL